MSKIISILNNKGGVGKSFLTWNLGSIFANDYRTLIIDNDAQGNLGERIFGENALDILEGGMTIAEAYDNKEVEIIPMSEEEGHENKELFFLASHRQKMERNVKRLPAKYGEYNCEVLLRNNKDFNAKLRHFDYVFIDNPPSLGVLSENALVISDYILIPFKPAVSEKTGILKLFDKIDAIKKKYKKTIKVLGVIVNDFYSREKVQENEIMELDEALGTGIIFDTFISHSALYERAMVENKPIDLKLRKEQLYVKVFEELKNEIIERIRKGV